MERSNSSWFGWWRKKAREGQGVGRPRDREKVVVDGSEIRELVEDREAFGVLVDSKFRQLDADGHGMLSVSELRPAVEDIGAALGLPAEGASPNTDHIYSEVVSELTHGTSQGEVSKAEFQEALSDILLGMAAGLKRDPLVILRMDGEDLRDFVAGSRYEPTAAAIFSQVGFGSEDASSLRQCVLAALHKLTVDHGVPPASDTWVADNIVEPALQQLPADQLEQQPASRDDLFQQLKKLLGAIADRLQEQPVIVAHTDNHYDGSGVKRLLANKFELDKLLDSVWKGLPAEHKSKASKEYLIAALDKMADQESRDLRSTPIRQFKEGSISACNRTKSSATRILLSPERRESRGPRCRSPRVRRARRRAPTDRPLNPVRFAGSAELAVIQSYFSLTVNQRTVLSATINQRFTQILLNHTTRVLVFVA